LKEWPAHPPTAAILKLLILRISFSVCFAADTVNHKSITEKAYFASMEENKKHHSTMMKEGFRTLSDPYLWKPQREYKS